ncbi:MULTISPECIES: hypothetical protein [unclassified Variovorax]|uniref:hypothetical protein n=1 Tax=unclassified Variovorax TaxID=663243 RepID=UPI00076D843B|nr:MULTISPECIES: hypothetical protein [unclassified Variovorax]KWT89306.1 hypothetical protein APY03_3385 [Variovorax sp. WDL1]PNG56483.1 hypothetical protein CHC07_02900 [Variovorax sp. B4]PNG57906.1 hypothetical protein CHC06_02902 [Variovorax sp. B2]VTV09631.1 hypothetical protein WDL1CHR_00724 [Variovorax sp. WDL1]
MTGTIITRDIFLRHTTVDGKSYVASHRVWDAERYIAAQKKAATDVNAKQDADKPRRACVDQITEEQYRAARAAR